MILIALIPFAIAVVWLLVIRPYCRRNGKGYTAGMNIATTAWVDWQEATEIAREKKDHSMQLICRIYLAGD